MGSSYRGVRGGTPTGEPLCQTCRNCIRMAGESLSSVEMLCMSRGENDRHIKFQAYECSAYDDKRLPSKWDMEQIAWVLTTDVKTKRIGFKSPTERAVASPGKGEEP